MGKISRTGFRIYPSTAAPSAGTSPSNGYSGFSRFLETRSVYNLIRVIEIHRAIVIGEALVTERPAAR